MGHPRHALQVRRGLVSLPHELPEVAPHTRTYTRQVGQEVDLQLRNRKG